MTDERTDDRTDEREPLRWRDTQSDCDPVLRRVLGNARRRMPAAQAEALARRIEHAVRAQVIADAGSSLLGGARGKWLIGVGLASIAVVWLVAKSLWIDPVQALRHGAAHEAAAPPPDATNRAVLERTPVAMAALRAEVADAQVEPAAPPSIEPAAQDALVVAQNAAAQPEPTPSYARKRGSKRALHVPLASTSQRPQEISVQPKPGVPEQTSVAPELQLLSAAQSALRASPSVALELADQHAQAYPGGTFAQEREEIAIDALFALGRQGAARDRARAFIARYPRSVQAVRLAKRLEGELP